MAIFQREGEAAGQSPAAQRKPAPAGGPKRTTVVAEGSRVKGEISGDTDVVVHGRVEGQLILGSTVEVGERGEVDGQIEARRVQVAGKVHGDIRASERIEVLTSGRIEGDVTAPRVAINAGAFFKGKVEMTSKAGAEAARPRQGSGEAPDKPAKSAADPAASPPSAAAKS